MGNMLQRDANTFRNGGSVLNEYERVIEVGGALIVADDVDIEYGIVTRRIEAGDLAAVQELNHGGKFYGIAAGAITAGAGVYRAASGRVAGTGESMIGKAVTSASTAGDRIEYIFFAGGSGGTGGGSPSEPSVDVTGPTTVNPLVEDPAVALVSTALSADAMLPIASLGLLARTGTTSDPWVYANGTTSDLATFVPALYRGSGSWELLRYGRPYNFAAHGLGTGLALEEFWHLSDTGQLEIDGTNATFDSQPVQVQDDDHLLFRDPTAADIAGRKQDETEYLATSGNVDINFSSTPYDQISYELSGNIVIDSLTFGQPGFYYIVFRSDTAGTDRTIDVTAIQSLVVGVFPEDIGHPTDQTKGTAVCLIWNGTIAYAWRIKG